MTYQGKYSELQKVAAEKSERFKKLNNEISSVNGFFDKKLYTDHLTAFKDLRIALENYGKFLKEFDENKPNPDDEYPEN